MISNQIQPKLIDNTEDRVSCVYQNLTSTWQIIKVTDLPDRCWEKVVLPGQKVFFKESIKANLKVFSSANITAIPIDTIPCHKLIAG